MKHKGKVSDTMFLVYHQLLTKTLGIMKFRVHEWFNTETLKPMFGVQAWDVKGEKWLHCFDGSGPCVYDTEKQAGDKIEELQGR